MTREELRDYVEEQRNLDIIPYHVYSTLIDGIDTLEPEPCYNPDEWCHDCKEYDHDKHCCPRYNKVIRNTVEEIKQSKTGYWISYWDEEARCYVYKCPECGNKQPFDTKCCWECGTRLVEPQESEETDERR